MYWKETADYVFRNRELSGEITFESYQTLDGIISVSVRGDLISPYGDTIKNCLLVVEKYTQRFDDIPVQQFRYSWLKQHVKWPVFQILEILTTRYAPDSTMLDIVSYKVQTGLDKNLLTSEIIPNRKEYRLFSNPVSITLTINRPLTGSIKIIRMDGQVVLNQDCHHQSEWNIDHLPNGTYSVLLDDQVNSAALKLVKVTSTF